MNFYLIFSKIDEFIFQGRYDASVLHKLTLIINMTRAVEQFSKKDCIFLFFMVTNNGAQIALSEWQDHFLDVNTKRG